MLGIRVASGHTPEEIADRLGKFPDVVYVLWVAGRYDLIVELVSDDRESLLSGRHRRSRCDVRSQKFQKSIPSQTRLGRLKRHDVFD
jgi:Lrp/AsnC family transcriptional regulator for asnA, asnC and gidA